MFCCVDLTNDPLAALSTNMNDNNTYYPSQPPINNGSSNASVSKLDLSSAMGGNYNNTNRPEVNDNYKHTESNHNSHNNSQRSSRMQAPLMPASSGRATGRSTGRSVGGGGGGFGGGGGYGGTDTSKRGGYGGTSEQTEKSHADSGRRPSKSMNASSTLTNSARDARAYQERMEEINLVRQLQM